MAALVVVMIMVSISTFSWESLVNLTRHPTTSSVVMLVTAATHNPALGVGSGVVLSAPFYTNKVQKLFRVHRETLEDGSHRYRLEGQVFFSSADQLFGASDFEDGGNDVVIDAHGAHFRDLTAATGHCRPRPDARGVRSGAGADNALAVRL